MAGLEDVKVGDEVALVDGYRPPRLVHVYEVTRLTNTQIICGRDKFTRAGNTIPKSPYRRVVMATDEHRNEMRHRHLSARLHYLEWSELPLATLEQIDALVRAAKENAGG